MAAVELLKSDKDVGCLPVTDRKKPAKRPLVLIVEDNDELRAYLREQLQPAYAVREAGDGELGLRRAQELVPDLVLADVMMPRRDGIQLCAALKSDSRTSHVPVVLLTAKADAESRIEGLQQRADDYLAKPFHRRELTTRIANLIEQRKRLQAKFSRHLFVGAKGEADLPAAETVFLERLREVISARMGDYGFGVDEIAREMAVSPRQLNRKLQALVGETAGSILRRMRLERALQLLENRTGQVQEVAQAVGFNSIPHFRRVFTQYHGLSPSKLAKQS